MNIDIKDRISLDDNNTYVVSGKTTYQNLIYYYLIDFNNIENVKFCYENLENNSMIEVEDEELVARLLPLFFESIPEDVKNTIFQDLLDN